MKPSGLSSSIDSLPEGEQSDTAGDRTDSGLGILKFGFPFEEESKNSSLATERSHPPDTIEGPNPDHDIEKGRYVEQFVQAICLARGADDQAQRKAICKNHFDSLKGYGRNAKLPQAVRTARNNLVAKVTIDSMSSLLMTVEEAEVNLGESAKTKNWCLEGIDLESMLEKLMTEKGASRERGGVTE
jgi:hypothetical protein